MQMQPLPQPSRCVHTPVAPGTRAGTRGDTSIHHPPSYPLTSDGDFSLEIETEMLNLEIDSLTHTLSRARELKSEI